MFRLYNLINMIVNKMTTYKTQTNKLCARFSNLRTIPTSISAGSTSGFSSFEGSITVYGNLQYTTCRATRKSNFSTGNITNEQYARMTLSNSTEENWTACTVFAANLTSCNSGGLKTYYCTYADNVYNNRVFTVGAVSTADTDAQFRGGIILSIYPSVL